MSKHLVIGLGEIGKSLHKVFKDGGADVYGIDKDISDWADSDNSFDFIHICIPPSKEFDQIVSVYKKQWLKTDGLLVIHSTVPVGTCRRLGAIHSPVHGIHPNLEAGIRTFVKYIGAEHYKDAERLLAEYSLVGIRGMIVKNPETSELSKLGCTTRHGLMIIEQKEFAKLCEKYGANFDEAYTKWNGHYSEGYRELGYPYLARACVKPMSGPIGGHCIVPNAEILGGPVAEFVVERNNKLKDESRTTEQKGNL